MYDNVFGDFFKWFLDMFSNRCNNRIRKEEKINEHTTSNRRHK